MTSSKPNVRGFIKLRFAFFAIFCCVLIGYWPKDTSEQFEVGTVSSTTHHLLVPSTNHDLKATNLTQANKQIRAGSLGAKFETFAAPSTLMHQPKLPEETATRKVINPDRLSIVIKNILNSKSETYIESVSCNIRLKTEEGEEKTETVSENNLNVSPNESFSFGYETSRICVTEVSCIVGFYSPPDSPIVNPIAEHVHREPKAGCISLAGIDWSSKTVVDFAEGMAQNYN